MRAQTVSTFIEQPFDDVYGFLADPLNFPSWGPVTSLDMHHVHGSDWLMHLERGPQILRFTEPNLYGVLDYCMFGAGEQPGLPVPVRLVRAEGGCELILHWRQRAGIDDIQFEVEQRAIDGYFQRLKAMLEADPAS
jgi:hypothetical protein